MNGPSVIAHRGASAHAPENTAAAFRLAARIGAAGVETDLRCTRDGRFVLLHDTRVNRTTDGRGHVAQIEFDALRRLDAGSWFGQEFAGERILTLEEGLALAEDLALGVYLEIKIALDAQLQQALARQLRRFPLDRLVLLSFHPETLRAIQGVEPRLKTALLVRRARPAIEAARQAKASLLAPHRRQISSRLVARAHQSGLDVVTWTVNSEREMHKMIAMGVDGIMTNWPDRLIEALRQDGFASSILQPAAMPFGKETT